MLAFLPVIGSIWANPIARYAILGAAIFAAGFWKGFEAVPRVDIPAVVRNAEAGRDAYWQNKLNATEEQARLAVDAAIEARDHPAAEPVDATVELWCKSDRDCVSNGAGH